MANLEDRASQSVTIKYGTAYDAPWHVVHGNTIADVKNELAGAYGLDAGRPLYELVAQASEVATTGKTLVNGLGATTVDGEVAPAKKEEPAKSLKEQVLEALGKATSKKVAQDLFIKHEKLISEDADVLEAFRNKMKSL